MVYMPVKINLEIKYLGRLFCKILYISLRVIKHSVEFDLFYYLFYIQLQCIDIHCN